MIVCHCKGVSDKTIRRVAKAGAASLEEVAAACGAGAECGGCHEVILRLISSESAERPLPSAGGAEISAVQLACFAHQVP